MNSESDFHISTDNDFSHLLQLSKKNQPMEMAGQACNHTSGENLLLIY